MEANALSEALCFTLAAFCCGCSSFVARCFFVDVVEAQCLCLVCWSCWSPVFFFLPCLLMLLKPSVWLCALLVDSVESLCLTFCLVCWCCWGLVFDFVPCFFVDVEALCSTLCQVSLLMLRPSVPHCAKFLCWCWGPVFHIVPSFFVDVEALCSTLCQVSLLMLRPCVPHCAKFLC